MVISVNYVLLCTIYLCSTRLAIQVRDKMASVEASNTEAEQTCFSLYAHFFISLLGLIEATVRLAFHVVVVCILYLGYYIVYCVSCGKAKLTDIFSHQQTRCSLYGGLVFAMLGNIFAPWKPPLYMYPRSSTLARPGSGTSGNGNGSGSGIHTVDGFHSSLDIESACATACCCCCNVLCDFKHGYCVCCGSPPESALPGYKLVQSSLSVVGCCRYGSGWYKCLGGEVALQKIHELQAEVSQLQKLLKPSIDSIMK